MNSNITDKKLLQLWRDPTFSGSYRGIKTFQTLLKTDLNLNISENRLYSVLKSDPIYIIHQRPQRNFDRRQYDIKNYGELVQADIAYMYEYKKFKYFLLLVDGFSSKIFSIKNNFNFLQSVVKPVSILQLLFIYKLSNWLPIFMIF